ncbi:hypothetical protein MauCBS54593_000589 [Microsporum audouinii]
MSASRQSVSRTPSPAPQAEPEPLPEPESETEPETDSESESESELSEPPYTPDELVEIFLDFYTFLTTLHYDIADLKTPPPGGWLSNRILPGQGGGSRIYFYSSANKRTTKITTF